MFYLFVAMNIYIICIKIRNGEQKENKGLKKNKENERKGRAFSGEDKVFL